MKKLLILLLLPLTLLGQATKIRKHDKHYDGEGIPTTNAGFYSLVDGATYYDKISGKTFYYKASTLKWLEDSTIYPTGKDGKDGVCPPCPPTGSGTFPWIVVVGANTGNDDAAIIAAFADNKTSGKPILFSGTITSGEISVPMDQYRLTLLLWGATINVRSTATAWLKRTIPTNNKQALDFYSPAQFIIKGGRINGAVNQVCFDLGASYMSRYEDTKIIGFKTAIHLRFALRTRIENVMAENCLNGFLVDIGNWPDASYTSSNAQSNQTTIVDCRVDYQIANASGDVAIGVYGCSGVVVENFICEGAKYKRAIDKDFKMCPNDKDFTARNLHLEGIYGNAGAGTGEAYIYIRLVGVAHIDGVYSQYGGCFIDAGGQPGELDLHIEHCSWLVSKNNKLFNNAGGVRWVFDTNSYQSLIYRASEISTAFTGTPVTQCTGALPCAPNTFRVQ